MKFRTVAGALALVSAVLTGCATKPTAPVACTHPATSAAAPVRIGVVLTTVPKPDTAFPGAGCLLCLGVAAAANSDLTKHAAELSTEDLAKIKGELTELLRKQGYDAVTITEDIDLSKFEKGNGSAPNQAVKDFTSLRDKFHVDKIAIVEVDFVGYRRNYSSYIPLGAPLATVEAQGYIVDLKTNAYDWYLPVNVIKGTDGEWSEPPAFPGLTNAYFQAIENAKDQIKAPFAK